MDANATSATQAPPPYTQKPGRLNTALRAVFGWMKRRIPQNVIMIFLALAIGVGAGASAAMLKRLVKLLNDLVLTGIDLHTPNIRFLIWPLAGILLTSLYQRYVVGHKVARGTFLIQQHLHNRDYRLGAFTVFNPVFGCSVTMGLGASGGTEGPVAYSGAAIGSVLAGAMRLSPEWRRLLVGIGAGAGIAAIFKSPMGGVLFTLEVLQMEISTVPVLALITASLFASCTAYLLSDFTFDIDFGLYAPMDPHTIWWICLLGFVCGLYCIYYNYTKQTATRLFLGIKKTWWAWLATGIPLSAGAFLFPVLFGEGFGMITALVNGDFVSFTSGGFFAGHEGTAWMFAAMAGVLLLKGVLVAASYSGGGVAGDFVPTIFAGSLAGFMFATGLNQAFALDLPPWYFALVGMGAVMAGTIHAPLMATFIVCETTNTYAYLLPYLLAVGVSYFTVKLLTPGSRYGGTGTDDLLGLWSSGLLPGGKDTKTQASAK